MTFSYFGPLTQTYGLGVTWTPDGSGGGTLHADAETDIVLTSTQMQDVETSRLMRRIANGEDVPTNWTSLQQHLLGNG